MRLLVTLALLGLVVCDDASAEVLGRVAPGQALEAGPVWGGGDAVWVERAPDGALTLRRAGARVAAFPRVAGGSRQSVDDLAASNGTLALVRRVERPAPPVSCVDCGLPDAAPTPVSTEVWAGPLAGPLRRVMRRPAAAQCAGALVPTEVEVVGAAVLVAEAAPDAPCATLRHRRVSGRVTELAGRLRPRTLARFGRETAPGHLAAAGRWAAWADGETLGDAITVFDRLRDRAAFRVPMRSFSAASFDVDGAGRLALAGEVRNEYPCHDWPVDVHRLAVASPAQPRPRLLRARADRDSVAISQGWVLSSGLVPTCRGPQVLEVRDSRRPGLPALPLYPRGGCGATFADYRRPEFDGRRILMASGAPPCVPGTYDPTVIHAERVVGRSTP